MEQWNTSSHEESKYELNEKEVTSLIPLLIYMSLIGLFGIPGNTLVIYAFKNSWRRSNAHLFFVWLAIIDLFNCSFILPFEFVNVVNQYTYENEWLCKMTIFFTIWLSVTSGVTLTVISVDRFRKVCRAFKWQFSNKTARNLSILTFIIGLLFAWPALIIFGLHDFDIPQHNVTGSDCAIKNAFEGSVYVKIYNGLLWLLFVSTIAIIIVLYVIIGRQIFKQKSKKIKRLTGRESELSRTQSSRANQNSECVSEDTISSSGGMPLGRTNSSGGISVCQKDSDDYSLSMEVQREFSTMCNERVEKKIAKSDAKARKSAMIMIFISVAFILSYLPYLILRLVEGITVHFVLSMPNTERILYKSFLRSYWLNCAVNPFIYSACAPHFRKEVKKLWLKIKCRK